jgi:4-hydroxy-tetrahydrodipicolinate synthase
VAADAVGSGAGKVMRGAFIILNTPFTSTADVDWDDLVREVETCNKVGCQGIVWPQGSSSVQALTHDERMHGMELLAKTVAGKRITLVLGVQGRDTTEMLEYAKRAEAVGTDAMIAMPPTTGKSLDDYRSYFRALGAATRRPVVIQTSGGARDLVPSTELIVDLAREFPHMGHVKEESDPVVQRMLAEVKQRPPMRSVFGASFADGWLYEMRLGLDGVITGEGMYADIMAQLWELHEQKKTAEVRDLFSKFLLMRNLESQVPGVGLFMMKKRGIFKTTVRRQTAPTTTGPAKFTEFTPTPVQLEEIEYRWEALKPYLRF